MPRVITRRLSPDAMDAVPNEAPCLIWQRREPGENCYWAARFNGSRESVDTAQVYTVGEAIGMAYPGSQEIHLFQDSDSLPIPPQRPMRTATTRLTREALMERTDDATPCLMLSLLATEEGRGFWGPRTSTSNNLPIEEAFIYTIGQAKSLATDSDVACLFTETASNKVIVVTRRMIWSEAQAYPDNQACLVHSNSNDPPYWEANFIGFTTLENAHVYTIKELKDRGFRGSSSEVHLFEYVDADPTQPALLTKALLEVDRNWSRGFIFHIKNRESGTWKREPANGWSEDFRDAVHHPLSEVKPFLDKPGFEVYFTPRKAGDVPMKKCSVIQVLTSTLIDLCKAAPLNPLTRGHLMKKCGQEVPIECDTWDKIKDWIEWNVSGVPGAIPPRPASSPTEPPPVPQPPREAFEIEVSATENEYGRATYSCINSGRGRISITEQDILTAAREAGSISELNESICDIIHNRATGEIDMDNSSDYEYEPEESGRTEDWDCDYNSTQVAERVRSFLATRNPELLATLEG